MTPRGVLLAGAGALVAAQYEPNWASLDSRPLPSWYDEAKVGIFINMGVYSVPSFGTPTGGASGEWFWHRLQTDKEKAYIDFVAATEAPGFTYPDYAPRFSAEFMNATEWAALFKAAGAKYVVQTSKHHDGWCNWPSATAYNWNSVDVGPKRDLVGEVADATRAAGMVFGVYHSLYEWYNPLYLADKATNFSTRSFVTGKTMPELYDLVNKYQPWLIWSDGDWEAPDAYWNSTAFLAWAANEGSPVKDTVVWNDRWGIGDTCHHGGYYTCTDRYLPSSKQGHKFENAFTLDRWSWGYRRNMELADVLSVDEVVATIAQTVALGGNALVSFGPTRDGTIDSVFQDRLLGMGAWLALNGEAIYATAPWRAQNDTAAGVWYTSLPAAGAVYAIATAWPAKGALTLTQPIPTASTTATLLGWDGGALTVTPTNGLGQPGLTVELPPLSPSQPLQHAWTVKLVGVQ